MKDLNEKLEKLLKESPETPEQIKKYDYASRDIYAYSKFLLALETAPDAQVKNILGKINFKFDTPGYYSNEYEDYDDIIDFIQQNLGKDTEKKLMKWWSLNGYNPIVINFVKKFTK